MEEQKEEMELLRFLYKERKWIIIAVVIASVLVIAATSMMEIKYKATGTVFPPGFNSADRMLENPQFGYNIEADRLIQIGESVNLKDSVIQYFDLINYYEIDQNDADWKDRLLKKYEKDISFERTKYMSVKITVLNRDPDQAAAMVQEIIDLLSRFWERLFKNNMLETLNYAQKMYTDKQSEVSAMLDSIYRLRGENTNESIAKLKKQMDQKQSEVEAYMNEISDLRNKGDFFDYGTKVELLNEEIMTTNRILEISRARMTSLEKSGKQNDTSYTQAKAKYEGAKEHKDYLEKNLQNLKGIDKKYSSLNEKLQISIEQYHQIKTAYEELLYSFEPLVESVELDYLEARYVSERNALNQLKEKFEKAHRYYNEPLPNLFVIESPRPIYKKASPSYSFNTLIAAFAAFVASIAYLLFARSISRIRKQIT